MSCGRMLQVAQCCTFFFRCQHFVIVCFVVNGTMSDGVTPCVVTSGGQKSQNPFECFYSCLISENEL